MILHKIVSNLSVPAASSSLSVSLCPLTLICIFVAFILLFGNDLTIQFALKVNSKCAKYIFGWIFWFSLFSVIYFQIINLYQLKLTQASQHNIMHAYWLFVSFISSILDINFPLEPISILYKIHSNDFVSIHVRNSKGFWWIPRWIRCPIVCIQCKIVTFLRSSLAIDTDYVVWRFRMRLFSFVCLHVIQCICALVSVVERHNFVIKNIPIIICSK